MKNKKLWYLVKNSLRTKTKSKWFLAINVFLLIIIPVLINIDNIIKYFGGDFNEPTKIYVVDNVGVYPNLKDSLESNTLLNDQFKINVKLYDKELKDLKKELKEEEKKDLIIVLEKNENNINADIITYEFVNTIIYQSIVSSLNNTKINYALLNSNINQEELAKIYEPIKIEREFLTEDLNENEELMHTIGSILIPIFIVPIFLLVVMVVNMLGAEINEEKTSRSMEIIISSVPPRTHFMSKIISVNLFIIIQGAIILFAGLLGLILRGNIMGMNIIKSFGLDSKNYIEIFINSGIFNNLIKALPFVILMIILTFMAYSLFSGILASMTTSMEDFQQLQTPVMLIMMFSYFLALTASSFESSSFIKVFAFIPFISGILAPVLLIIGQISYIDIIISTLLLMGTNYILIKYGIKIYKVGILNYSSSKLWKKMFKAVKD